MLEREMLDGDTTIDFDRTMDARPVGYLRDGEGLTLTTSGRDELSGLGVDLPASDRVRCCIDWTEQRHHISGPHGRAVFNRLVDLGWLRRSDNSRAVHVTHAGTPGFATTFGIDTGDI
jgi:hypothetical protein